MCNRESEEKKTHGDQVWREGRQEGLGLTIRNLQQGGVGHLWQLSGKGVDTRSL